MGYKLEYISFSIKTENGASAELKFKTGTYSKQNQNYEIPNLKDIHKFSKRNLRKNEVYAKYSSMV